MHTLWIEDQGTTVDMTGLRTKMLDELRQGLKVVRFWEQRLNIDKHIEMGQNRKEYGGTDTDKLIWKTRWYTVQWCKDDIKAICMGVVVSMFIFDSQLCWCFEFVEQIYPAAKNTCTYVCKLIFLSRYRWRSEELFPKILQWQQTNPDVLNANTKTRC